MNNSGSGNNIIISNNNSSSIGETAMPWEQITGNAHADIIFAISLVKAFCLGCFCLIYMCHISAHLSLCLLFQLYSLPLSVCPFLCCSSLIRRAHFWCSGLVSLVSTENDDSLLMFICIDVTNHVLLQLRPT